MKILKAVIALVVVAAIGVGAFMFFTSPEQRIKGKWESEYLTLDFDKEGNVEVTYLDTEKFDFDLPVSGKGSFDGTYSIEKEEKTTFLNIKATVTVGIEFSYDFKYILEFEDGDMILTPVYDNGEKGEEITFKKAE